MFLSGAILRRRFQYRALIELSRLHWRARSFGMTMSPASLALPHVSTISVKLFILHILGQYPKYVKGQYPNALSG